MAAYVKFIRGTVEAFNNLPNKNSDILYFIYDNENSETGSLYLGDKKISDGNIKELIPDNITLVKDEDNKIYLKDFGERFYKYTSEGYILTEVSDENPWKEGLEPRVTEDSSGKFVLGWYEPNTSTIEGLETAIAEINTAVGNLDTRVENLEKIDIDKKISEKIAETSFLSYKKVEGTKNDIDLTAADAHKFIYLVQNEKNPAIYDEYMVINGSLEIIGDTAISLEGYATEDYVQTAIAELPTDEDVNTAISNAIADLATKEEVNNAVKDLATKSYVDAETAKLATTEYVNQELESLKTADGDLNTRIENVEGTLTWETL